MTYTPPWGRWTGMKILIHNLATKHKNKCLTGNACNVTQLCVARLFNPVVKAAPVSSWLMTVCSPVGVYQRFWETTASGSGPRVCVRACRVRACVRAACVCVRVCVTNRNNNPLHLHWAATERCQGYERKNKRKRKKGVYEEQDTMVTVISLQTSLKERIYRPHQ
jgi:hypothetical protein